MINYPVISRYCPRYMFRSLVLMLFLFLAGCTILPEIPVSQVYLLPVQTPPTSILGVKSEQSLRIVQPNTNQFLNGTRIAVQPQGAEITAYSGARWSDTTAILLRNHLIQAFRSERGFSSVSSDEDNLQTDIELSGDLLSFQGVYQESVGEVVIRFDARLAHTSDRQVFATHRFVVRQAINGRGMENVVQAFGQASDQLAVQMQTWVHQQVK